MFLVILFSVSFMSSFHVKCCSNKIPRNLIDSFLCISWLLIISFGRRRGTWSFLLGLWKNEYFVFSTYKDSLFAVNQSLMFTSFLFTTVKRCLMSLWLKKRLVSSAKMIGSNEPDAFGRSLTYTRNRSGPRIDPWRNTTSNIFMICSAIFTFSMYHFQLDK